MSDSVLKLARRFVAERAANSAGASEPVARATQVSVPRDTHKACPAGQPAKAVFTGWLRAHGTNGTGGTRELANVVDLTKLGPRLYPPSEPVATNLKLDSSGVIDASRDEIAAALGRLPRPCNDEGQRLFHCTRDFIYSPMFEAAGRLGWSTIELFGIAPALGRVPIGTWGLVTTMATVLEPCWVINVVTEAGAKLMGNRQRRAFWPRARLNEACVVWWECDEIMGDFD